MEPLVDSDHPDLVAFAQRAQGDTDREVAVALFYAVRDGFRYDPYRLDLSPAGMRASTVVQRGYGWCVTKATLLTAACRARGIPARLGFADVRNHLSTARMREAMGTDIFFWHGFSEILLGGQWLKATPAFNIELCDKFGLLPLEFDGRSDSVYHPFDKAGHRHMEYVRERGSFDDVPLEQILADLMAAYPGWREEGDFLTDVAAETAAGREPDTRE